MEFTHIFVLALFCLGLVGSNGSKSGEEYWKSVWPNTPIPKTISNFILPESESYEPIKAEEEKQYWTVFFEHDLYPGKKITLGVHKHYDIQPLQSTTWQLDEKTSQPFGAGIWFKAEADKDSRSFGAHTWDRKESQPLRARKWGTKGSQPFGAGIWFKAEGEKESQPFEARTWDGIESQPFGAHIKGTKEIQPFGVGVWLRTMGTKESQSFGETLGKEGHPSGGHSMDEKDRESLKSYCATPSAIGEEKYCAPSLESMIDFAISKLGKNIKMISSSFAKNQDQYVIEEVKKLGDKAVMCHRLNFKKVVFYCHQVNATTAYIVPLVSSDGTKSKALTICHHDTRGMDPKVLYDVLKVKPGTIPICHFVGNKAIAWVPNDVVNEHENHPCVI